MGWFDSLVSSIPIIGSVAGAGADIYQTIQGNDFNRDQLRWQKEQAQQNYEYQKYIDQKNATSSEFWNQQNFNLQKETTAKNFELQTAQQQYERDLQQLMLNREDTATQRRAADLKAAGLSPVLAAGSAANAGTVIKTTTPQMDQIERNFTPQGKTSKEIPNFQQLQKFSGSQIAQLIQYAIRQDPEISRTLMQTDLNAAQIATQNAQSKLLEAERAKVYSERKRVEEEIKRMSRDNKIYEQTGTTSNPSQVGKIFNDLIGPLMNFRKKMPAPIRESENNFYNRMKNKGGK